MRKLVNGKVVDIDNIELFELAAEGLAKNSRAISKTCDGVPSGIRTDMLNRLISQYDIFYSSMPYPLYAIEQDIKYATLANFIRNINKNNLTMWVKNGLHIVIDNTSNATLYMCGSTWSIEFEIPQEPRTDLSLYIKSCGYKEYTWFLDALLRREKKTTFYEKFMPEFVKACNGNETVLRWELENILNFGTIPRKISLIDNKIIDFTNNCEYMLDIFIEKTVEAENEKYAVWGLTSGSISSRSRKINIYGYKVYVKSLSTDATKCINGTSEFSKCDVPGMQTMFVTLSGIKNSKDRKSFPVYKGLVIDNDLVYEVDNRLYTCKVNRVSEAVEIAGGVEVYGVDRSSVYFTKSVRLAGTDIEKETLYSYNLSNKTLRLCNIRYKVGGK